jgi:glucokinase
MAHPANRYSLVADIGGTNTRCALMDGLRIVPDTVRRYANKDHASLESVLRTYLADEGGVDPAAACVAVAGPVRDGRASLTNVDWSISTADLTRATRAERVAILNDLQAQGQALGHIAADKLRVLVDGPVVAGGPMLVVGLGTGVNAAPVHPLPAGRVVPSSECGHVNLPVRGPEDLALAGFVRDLLQARGETAHAGVEEVLSGRGLGNLYAFTTGLTGAPQQVNSAAVLQAMADEAPAALHAAAIYARVLGQFLADQALIHLPYGGLYLIGGMARAMAPHVMAGGLTGHFRDARRVDLLQHAFSICVVEDDYAALIGCAAYLAGPAD